jgi:hypothetical protein
MFKSSRRWAGHIARMGEWRSEYRVLVGKSEGKRPLGRSRCKWKNNNGSSGTGMRGMDDWIAIAQDRAR